MDSEDTRQNSRAIVRILKLSNGEKITFRHLLRSDSEELGTFFEGLSEFTRKRYGPHPLTRDEALNICFIVDDPNILRLISLDSKGKIIAYFLLSFSFRNDELVRYKGYGINILAGRDLRLAPVVLDTYQNQGLGSLMLQETIRLAKKQQSKYLVLWMGVQATNERAIHFYSKVGFKKVGEFYKYDTNNFDMYLEL